MNEISFMQLKGLKTMKFFPQVYRLNHTSVSVTVKGATLVIGRHEYFRFFFRFCYRMMVVKSPSLSLLPTLYAGCQRGRMRVFNNSTENRVNIPSRQWCLLLNLFSQDGFHPLHSWDHLHCLLFILPVSALLSIRTYVNLNDTHALLLSRLSQFQLPLCSLSTSATSGPIFLGWT